MQISSPAFANGEAIPPKYSYNGENVNPPLQFSDIPAEAKSLALVVEDPDAPKGTFTHWLLWNMRPDRHELPENFNPPEAVTLENGFGEGAYGGPRPPSGTHRYYFRLYALDQSSERPADGKGFRRAMADHILEEASLMGVFAQKDDPKGKRA